MFCVPVFFPPPDDESPPAYRARSRRVLLICLAVCFLFGLGAVCLYGQEPPPMPPTPAATLKIAGKVTAAIGEELRLPVEGLKSPDVSGGLKPVVDWSGRIRVIVDGPDKSNPLVEPDMLLGLGAEAVRIRLNFIADSGGVYVVILHDGNSGAIATKRITVGPVVPTPNPPPGPGPGPGPSPGPSPIPLTGLRVLILEETADRAKLAPAQAAILTSTEIRAWLNSRCAKGESGSPEFRVLDVDADVSLQAKHWQDALKRPRTTLPWILISDGKQGHEGPLPGTIAETLSLLQKYGG